MKVTQPIEITADLLATSGQRFCNYLVDIAMFYAFVFMLGVLLALLTEFTDNSIWTDWLVNISKIEDYIFSYIVLLSYYTIAELISQRTIGKYITNTVVVDQNGQKPAIGSIIKRSLFRLIPFDGLTFLGNTRGWHDSFSDTYVVKKNILDRKLQFQREFDEIGATAD